MILGSIYLAILFLCVAMLYASIGFGGGSTYIAILALSDVSYEHLPIIALFCNIIVVTGGSYRFARQDLVPWRRILPILLFSVPAAWLGGRTPISRDNFMLILGAVLISAALMILLRSILNKKNQINQYALLSKRIAFVATALLGLIVGYISGLVGIGGGIFLAPLLLLINWGESRSIAATASIFILLNSIAGLMGQLDKYTGTITQDILVQNISLFIAVFVGGQMGSHMAVKILSEMHIRILTALLTLYVGIKIIVGV